MITPLIPWWNEARVAELRIRWANNETGSQIMHAMGAPSRNVIVGKAYRLKLPPHNTAANGVNGHNGRSPRPANRRKAPRMIEPIVPEIFKNPKRFIRLREGDCRWPGAAAPAPMHCFQLLKNIRDALERRALGLDGLGLPIDFLPISDWHGVRRGGRR